MRTVEWLEFGIFGINLIRLNLTHCTVQPIPRRLVSFLTLVDVPGAGGRYPVFAVPVPVPKQEEF